MAKSKKLSLLSIFFVGMLAILVIFMIILDFLVNKAEQHINKSMLSIYTKTINHTTLPFVIDECDDFSDKFSYMLEDVVYSSKTLSERAAAFIDAENKDYFSDLTAELKINGGNWKYLINGPAALDIRFLPHITDYMSMHYGLSQYCRNANAWVYLTKPRMLTVFSENTFSPNEADYLKNREFYDKRFSEYKWAEDKHEPIWTDLNTQITENNKIVSVVSPIYDKYGKLAGSAGIDLDIADIVSRVLDNDGNFFFKKYDKYYFLLTKDLSVIYVSDFLQKQLPLTEQKTTDGTTFSDEFKHKDKGAFFHKVNTFYSLIVFSRIESNGWVIGIVLPSELLQSSLDETNLEIRDSLNNLAGKYLLIAAALLCIPIFLFVLFFEYFVLAPIKNVRKAIIQIGKGDFNVSFKLKGIMEIEQLICEVEKLGRELVDYTNKLTNEAKARYIIESEMEVASEIQTSILPAFTPEFVRKEFDMNAKISPAKGNISGDFYDYFYLDTYTLVLIIGDVAGKGIGAAFFMNVAKFVIRNVCMQNSSLRPGEMLSIINEVLSSNNNAKMFLTMYLCFYDIRTGSLIYSNAGHHEIIKINKNGEYIYFGAMGNTMVGLYPDLNYKDKQLSVSIGDIIVFFTDGITEAINSKDEPYGEEKLASIIKNNREKKCSELNDAIISSVISFEKGNRFDDITLLSLKRLK